MQRRKIGFLLLILLGAAQFIQPPHHANPQTNADDLKVHYTLPPDVEVILRQACYDCHSNATEYPWYSYVQPVGWWIQDHVDRGREALNFSAFGTYQREDHAIIFREMDDVLLTRMMPLTSYQVLHPEARLTDEQVRRLREWIQELRASIPKDR